ncbi:MAG: hypothetical protein H7124_08960 [Phycisphaerales bacterium]|nr:hypothetical protein [Hyphomonadaceae bacterium]
MKLTCYPLQTYPAEIRPGRPERAWMDDFTDRHAYRCLPLTIANCTGWEILTPAAFSASWNGGPALSDVTFQSEGDVHKHFAGSMFARGVVTFNTGYLFRTESGWDTWVGGAPNWIKHGIQPLTGIVETSWLPQAFTMNWRFTAPGTVSFEAGEPFCMIMPVPHAAIDACTPVIKALADNPALEAETQDWMKSRSEFVARLRDGDPEAAGQVWQRTYFAGKTLRGEAAVGDHIHKRRLATPRRAGEDDV